MPHIFVRGGGPPFLPMGLLKSGTATVPQNVAAIVAGWTADPSYSGTVLAANKMVVSGPKSGVTITASMPWTASLNIYTGGVLCMIYINGVMLQASSAVLGSSGTCTVTATGVTLAAGDTVELWAGYSNGIASTVTMTTATYIRFS
ncbi:hypothetical protein ACHMZP_21835 [Rhodococcus baikonurensis]|uniref:hypothetical protein n=1 Tax=Rhodococcus baikonurensis TaxID=172041 RepID=UPI0037A2111C